MMKPSLIFQFVLFGLLLLIFISAVTAFAANLTIPETNIELKSIQVTAQQIKPPSCTMALVDIVRGSGTFSGSGFNNLIFGSSGDDTITVGGGVDCILAGDGNNICYGEAGTVYFSCESINPPSVISTSVSEEKSCE